MEYRQTDRYWIHKKEKEREREMRNSSSNRSSTKENWYWNSEEVPSSSTSWTTNSHDRIRTPGIYSTGTHTEEICKKKCSSRMKSLSRLPTSQYLRFCWNSRTVYHEKDVGCLWWSVRGPVLISICLNNYLWIRVYSLPIFMKFGHSGSGVRTFRRNLWTTLHKKIKIIV